MKVGAVGGRGGCWWYNCSHVAAVLELGDAVVAGRVAATPFDADGGGGCAVQLLVLIKRKELI